VIGVLVQPTLVLNSSFLPVSVVRVMEAICLLVTSKADLIDGDEGELIRSQRLSIPLPRVVRLLNFNGIPSNPAWSRLKVIYRDDMTCAWCGKRGRMEELDCDHIIPRSRWHACPQNLRRPYEVPRVKLQNAEAPWNSWMNTLAACRKCNAAKGNLYPWEMGRPFATSLSLGGTSPIHGGRRPLWAPYEPEYVPSIIVSFERAKNLGWLDYLLTRRGTLVYPSGVRVAGVPAGKTSRGSFR